MASITDTPITSIAQDLLQIKTYSDALSEFIAESDTPITIGLQGEWGTGKTSLMAILLENLSLQNIATSWVNTWEHSLLLLCYLNSGATIMQRRSLCSVDQCLRAFAYV